MALNPEQSRAVRFLERPLLVIAGAGSGKTRVITEKVAYLVERGFGPGLILAVTFTNKAAQEMRERLARRLPKGAQSRLLISTFHAFGLELLRREGRALGLRPRFSVLDEADRLELLRGLLEEEGIDPKELPELAARISWFKNRPDGARESLFEAYRRRFGDAVRLPLDRFLKLLEAYHRRLRAYQAVDFDDLILLPLKLLQDHPEVRERWQRRIAYLLVDEWQDTNPAQYLLFRELVGEAGNFTVVGDDDQAIYGWRGADPENLGRLLVDFPDLEVVTLERNYRSSGTILEAANALIAQNPHLFPKRLRSVLGGGEPLRLLVFEDEEREAEGIAFDLWSRKRQGGRWGDFAILYRGNHQARLLERALRQLSIPYTVRGGTSFFAHREVKDLIAYLRLLANPDDDLAFLRAVTTPRREIGPVTLEKLSGYAHRRGISLFEACFELGLESSLPGEAVRRLRRFCEWLVDLADRLRRGDPERVLRGMVEEEIGYLDHLERNSGSREQFERRRGRVEELLSWIVRLFEEALAPPASSDPLSEVVQRLLLYDLLDQKGEERDAVALMTIHAAKGLEFEGVYVVGLVDGLLPHENSPLEEERRLLYVAITRARSHLVLSYPKKSRSGTPLEPSRFLEELPEELLKRPSASSEEERRQKARAAFSAIRELLGEP